LAHLVLIRSAFGQFGKTAPPAPSHGLRLVLRRGDLSTTVVDQRVKFTRARRRRKRICFLKQQPSDEFSLTAAAKSQIPLPPRRIAPISLRLFIRAICNASHGILSLYLFIRIIFEYFSQLP
jgi:hypothetical protein